MDLVRKVFWVWECECLCQTFVSVTMRSINILLGGSFGVRYSDSKDLNCNYIEELVKKTRVI